MQFDFTLRDVLDHLGNRVLGRAVVFVERRIDLRIRSHLQMVQSIDRIQIGGITDGNSQIVPMPIDRNDSVTLGDVPGNGRNHLVLQTHVRQAHHLHAEMRRLGCGDRGRVDQLLLYQQVHHALAVRIGLRLRGLDLFGRHISQLDQLI